MGYPLAYLDVKNLIPRRFHMPTYQALMTQTPAHCLLVYVGGADSVRELFCENADNIFTCYRLINLDH